MILSHLLRLASRNLLRNRRRTIITLVSISLSVALTSVLRFLTFGVHQENIDQVVDLTTGYIQVAAYGWLESRKQLDRALDYTAELENRLDHPDVRTISPRIESGALIAFGENSAFVEVQGADPSKEQRVTRIHEHIVEGKDLEEYSSEINTGNVNPARKGGDDGDRNARDQKESPVFPIVIGERLASNLEVAVGDEVSVVGTRFDGSTGAMLGLVVGLVKTGNPGLDGNRVWTNLEAGRQLFSPDDIDQGIQRYTSLVIGAEGALEAEDLYDSLKDRFIRPETELPPEYASNYEPVIHFWDELNQDLVQYLLLDQIGNEITLLFLILIMAAGVMTTVEMSLHERRREFGILMAIGTRGSHLVQTTLVEVTLLLLLGTIPGLLIGIAGGLYLEFNPIVLEGEFAEAVQEMGSAVTIRAIVNLKETYIALLSLCLPALLLSYMAIRKIPKLNPVEVISVL